MDRDAKAQLAQPVNPAAFAYISELSVSPPNSQKPGEIKHSRDMVGGAPPR
jgi:hypothetical protein